MKILIAEDNPDNMSILSRRLRRRGFEVYGATDGKQAVDAAVRMRPDLILMDVSMPVISGLDAVRAIREREEGGPRTPIIALTAHAMESDKARSLNAGCDAFVTKPINFSLVLKKIMEFRHVGCNARFR